MLWEGFCFGSILVNENIPQSIVTLNMNLQAVAITLLIPVIILILTPKISKISLTIAFYPDGRF